MTSPGSVSQWIGRIKAGDAVAAQALSDRYFARLIGLARKRLRGLRSRAADEEDVALHAFASFCRGVEQGRFPQLSDRNSLWHLLVRITVNKSLKLARQERAVKRGGGAVEGESALVPAGESAEGAGGLDQLPGPEPTPEFVAEMAERCQVLFDRLGADNLRAVALLKMEGYTNGEIAEKLGCVVATVERRLKVIRNLWDPAKGQR